MSRKPDVIFLSETRVNSSRIESIRGEIKFDGCFVVDRLAKGWFGAFWKRLRVVTLIKYSLNYVNLEVWVWTFFYRSNLPWVCIKDFNDLLWLEDKREDNLYPLSLLQGFRDVVDNCNLIDISLVGYPFTLENGKGTLI